VRGCVSSSDGEEEFANLLQYLKQSESIRVIDLKSGPNCGSAELVVQIKRSLTENQSATSQTVFLFLVIRVHEDTSGDNCCERSKATFAP
jgi:hypothetical protein